MKRLTYDIEIKKGIVGRNESPVDGIEYCQGWSDHKGMGISVLCAWDTAARSPLVFWADNLDKFAAVANQYDQVGSFNGVGFDRKVLTANGIDYDPAKDYDVLRELWIADGLDPDKFNPRTHGGYGLDACTTVNFGIGKSGNGAEAPIWYQRGEFGQLITYCLRDVILTARLIAEIETKGGLIHPKTKQFTMVRKPDENFDDFLKRRADATF